MVYIREAHPNERKNRFPISDPKSLEERQRVAKEFAEQLKVSIPVLVDTIDDQAERAYAGWPDRVYVIDQTGKVAHKGAPGPGGFSPAVRATPAILDSLLAR